jgi:hypothetical protein
MSIEVSTMDGFQARLIGGPFGPYGPGSSQLFTCKGAPRRQTEGLQMIEYEDICKNFASDD